MIFDELGKADPAAVDGKPAPDAKVVDWIHSRTGTGRNDLHHRLGFGEEDAAAGNHTHDGQNSLPLWQSGQYDFTPLAGTATLAQTIAKVNVILSALRSISGG